MGENSVVDDVTCCDPVVADGRAGIFAEVLFKKEIYSSNASAYIADYCITARARLKLYSKEAQSDYPGNEEALISLAGQVKYVLAYIELAECYGKHLGIITENVLFRQNALTYISMVHAQNEALEYFHFDD
jgi:hypothetical protein